MQFNSRQKTIFKKNKKSIMDFTYKTYTSFLKSLKSREYFFTTSMDYFKMKDPWNKNLMVILRHDVDRLPQNSLRTAEIEYSLGIKGTYYFRIVPGSLNNEIVKKISGLGHEIGYHYEDIDLARKKNNIKDKKDKEILIDLAYESFCKNLEKLRKINPIKTICAHGSPLSPFDNKMIWSKYDYKKLEIIGEPYLDLDWKKFIYLTDTGRKWNGNNVSVRDKIKTNNNQNYKTTFDIINNVNNLSPYILFTIHPQRWNDNLVSWTRELASQSAKNIIKKYFFVKN